jgi:hypothetical protein
VAARLRRSRIFCVVITASSKGRRGEGGRVATISELPRSSWIGNPLQLVSRRVLIGHYLAVSVRVRAGSTSHFVCFFADSGDASTGLQGLLAISVLRSRSFLQASSVSSHS